MQAQARRDAHVGETDPSAATAPAGDANTTGVAPGHAGLDPETPHQGYRGRGPAADSYPSSLQSRGSSVAPLTARRSVATAVSADPAAQLHAAQQMLQNPLVAAGFQQLFNTGALGHLHGPMQPMQGVWPPALSVPGNSMPGSGMPFGSTAPPLAFGGSHQPPATMQAVAMGQTYASAHGHMQPPDPAQDWSSSSGIPPAVPGPPDHNLAGPSRQGHNRELQTGNPAGRISGPASMRPFMAVESQDSRESALTTDKHTLTGMAQAQRACEHHSRLHRNSKNRYALHSVACTHGATLTANCANA